MIHVLYSCGITPSKERAQMRVQIIWEGRSNETVYLQPDAFFKPQQFMGMQNFISRLDA